MKQRRSFSAEQKSKIVLDIISGKTTISKASTTHHTTPSLLHKWRDQFIENAQKLFKASDVIKEENRKIKHYEHVIAKLTT